MPKVLGIARVHIVWTAQSCEYCRVPGYRLPTILGIWQVSRLPKILGSREYLEYRQPEVRTSAE